MKTVSELAREAGGGLSCIAEPLEHPWKFSRAELERFADLIRADEREACAKVCDEHNARQRLSPEERYAAYWLAAAIRARGNK